jgi:hypothetical protein
MTFGALAFASSMWFQKGYVRELESALRWGAAQLLAKGTLDETARRSVSLAMEGQIDVSSVNCVVNVHLDQAIRLLDADREVWERLQLSEQMIELDYLGPMDLRAEADARTSREHVFQQLDLALPGRAIALARVCHSHGSPDELRPLAIEYFDQVLPKHIKKKLWPFIDIPLLSRDRMRRTREELLMDVLRMKPSLLKPREKPVS